MKEVLDRLDEAKEFIKLQAKEIDYLQYNEDSYGEEDTGSVTD
jgi:hypothetical protein